MQDLSCNQIKYESSVILFSILLWTLTVTSNMAVGESQETLFFTQESDWRVNKRQLNTA
jgi:hypothetical protein